MALSLVGRQVASEAQLYEGKRAWRMEAVANAAMRRGGSELRDAFLEALLESKSIPLKGLRHTVDISNLEGSMDTMAAIEETLLGEELVEKQKHTESRATVIHREVVQMNEIMAEATENFSTQQHLYDFFATAHHDWVQASADAFPIASLRRLWQAELRIQWMQQRLRKKSRLVAVLNSEVVGLRTAMSESSIGISKKVRVGPLGPMPRKVVPPGTASARGRPVLLEAAAARASGEKITGMRAAIEPPGMGVRRERRNSAHSNRGAAGVRNRATSRSDNNLTVAKRAMAASGNFSSERPPASQPNTSRSEPSPSFDITRSELSSDEEDSDDFSDSMSTLSEMISELQDFNFEAESRLSSRHGSVAGSRPVTPPLTGRSHASSDPPSIKDLDGVLGAAAVSNGSKDVDRSSGRRNSAVSSEVDSAAKERADALNAREAALSAREQVLRVEEEKQRLEQERLAQLAAANAAARLVRMQEEREQELEAARQRQEVEETAKRRRAAAASLWGQNQTQSQTQPVVGVREDQEEADTEGATGAAATDKWSPESRRLLPGVRPGPVLKPAVPKKPAAVEGTQANPQKVPPMRMPPRKTAAETVVVPPLSARPPNPTPRKSAEGTTAHGPKPERPPHPTPRRSTDNSDVDEHSHPAAPVGGDAARMARAAASAAAAATPRELGVTPRATGTPREQPAWAEALDDSEPSATVAPAPSKGRPDAPEIAKGRPEVPKGRPDAPWAGRATAAIVASRGKPGVRRKSVEDPRMVAPEAPKEVPTLLAACVAQLYQRGLKLRSIFEVKVIDFTRELHTTEPTGRCHLER